MPCTSKNQEVVRRRWSERMGNCLDRTAADEELGNERWEFDGEVTVHGRGEKGGEGKAADASPNLVKMVITRKQWEELMSHADLRGLDVHKLLSYMNIMNNRMSPENVGRGHQLWRPSLQSIPEASE